MSICACIHMSTKLGLKKDKNKNNNGYICTDHFNFFFSSVSWLINLTFNFVPFSLDCGMKQDLEK